MLKIYYSNETSENISNYKKAVTSAIEETLKKEKIKENIEISLTFVNDNDMKKLNKKYRDKNKPTDVLSFPMLDYVNRKTYKDMDKEFIKQNINTETRSIMLGDIVVSMETIRKQAKEFNNTIKKELLLMVIHSTLHLLGYDHMEESEKKVMFEKQLKILEGLH